VIERVFAFLKGHFRHLNYLEMSHVDLLWKFIVECCVLYDLRIQQYDLLKVVAFKGDERHCTAFCLYSECVPDSHC